MLLLFQIFISIITVFDFLLITVVFAFIPAFATFSITFNVVLLTFIDHQQALVIIYVTVQLQPIVILTFIFVVELKFILFQLIFEEVDFQLEFQLILVASLLITAFFMLIEFVELVIALFFKVIMHFVSKFIGLYQVTFKIKVISIFAILILLIVSIFQVVGFKVLHVNSFIDFIFKLLID